jgi:hypothetical protein
MLSLDFDQDLTPDTFTSLFKPRIAVVAIRNDLYERAQNIFAYGLVRLLEGNPICVL